MKKFAVSACFLFLVCNQVIAEENKILEANTGTPIVISLTNKHDGGEWLLEGKPDNLQMESTRKGYLYTYFIFKSLEALQGPVSFKYQSGAQSDKRTYFVKVSATPHSEKSVRAQSAPESKDDLVIISEEKKRDVVLKMPENVQLYLKNLVEEGLYDTALTEIERLESSENENIERNWLIQQKIQIWERKKAYPVISAFAQNFLNDTDAESPLSNSMEFFIRLSKAKADYYDGKKSEAWGQFIFLKNYFPDNATVYYELGKFYFQEGLIQKGVSMYEYLLSKFQDPPAKDEVYHHLAKYYYQVVGINGYHLSHKYYKKIVNLGVMSPFYTDAKQMTDFLERNFINIR